MSETQFILVYWCALAFAAYDYIGSRINTNIPVIQALLVTTFWFVVQMALSCLMLTGIYALWGITTWAN